MIIHQQFVNQAIETISTDQSVVGLAIGGSWIHGEIDRFSDLDLVLITNKSVSDHHENMLVYARKLGNLLNAFTGEHVGEKRLLICLYEDPLLHVDIKFVTLEELPVRVENPVVVFEREGKVSNKLSENQAIWPPLDCQWIEDRFWTWIHYISLKIGRGEYFEALDAVTFLRAKVISPLMQIKNHQLPRGLRKVEQTFAGEDLRKLIATVPAYNAQSIIGAVETTIQVYQELRHVVFPEGIKLRSETEQKCLAYFYEIRELVNQEGQ